MAEAVRRLRALATLDDIAGDPASAEELSPGEVSTLLVRAHTVAGILQGRIARQAVMDASMLRGRERILSAEQVAERIGRSISWIEKHFDSLPPRRAIGGAPGWREEDINAYIRNSKPYVTKTRA